MGIHYDFTVKRRQRTWFIRGHLDGVDIGGDYEGKKMGSEGLFPPSSWSPPENYW